MDNRPRTERNERFPSESLRILNTSPLDGVDELHGHKLGEDSEEDRRESLVLGLQIKCDIFIFAHRENKFTNGSQCRYGPFMRYLAQHLVIEDDVRDIASKYIAVERTAYAIE